MSEYILETSGLSKTFGRKKVIDNVDIKIKKGDIYGFIGRNGAGKSTVIKLISNIIKPSEGVINFSSDDNGEPNLRNKLGVIIENPAYYPYMSARDNIKVQAIMKNIEDMNVIDEILQMVGLSDAGNKKVKNFSLGMKQRLAIAIALVGEPEFLILDEPTNGLDPMGIKELRNLILKLNKDQGITFFISSHILGELAKVCTSYGIISDGKLVSQITSDELNEKIRSFIELKVNDIDKSLELIKSNFEISDIEVSDGFIKIYEKLDEMMNISSLLEENDIIVSSVSKKQGDSEDYLIDLMGGGADNA